MYCFFQLNFEQNPSPVYAIFCYTSSKEYQLASSVSSKWYGLVYGYKYIKCLEVLFEIRLTQAISRKLYHKQYLASIFGFELFVWRSEMTYVKINEWHWKVHERTHYMGMLWKACTSPVSFIFTVKLSRSRAASLLNSKNSKSSSTMGLRSWTER